MPRSSQHLLAFLFLLCGVCLALARSPDAAIARPNVIVYLVDDLGWTDAACLGSDLYETPNIDRLAAGGMRFTDAYSACTVCSPTRAAMMTGMVPARLRLTDWIDGAWSHLPPKRQNQLPLVPPDWTQRLEHRYTTLAEALQAAGYQTAHVGKWHLTPRSDDPSVVEPYYPQRHGFAVNVAGNQWGTPGSYYWPYRLPRAQSTILARVANFPPPETTKDKYLTDMLTDEAIGLIQRWKDKPFFLYFAHYAVHTPLQARPDLLKKYRRKVNPTSRHKNARYAAMVESVDQSVGRLIRRLDELDLTENTLFVFTSDNGGLTIGRNPPTDNAPLRAGKGSAYEGGVRVPAIVSWPGVVPAAAVCHEPIITCDWYPTVLEVTHSQGDAAHNANVDGVSLLPVLKRPTEPLGHRELYWHYPHYHQGGAEFYSAVRSGPWRLVHFYEDDHVELYNLADDLGEKTNLAKSNPAKAAELREKLDRWRKRIGAQPPRKNPSHEPP